LQLNDNVKNKRLVRNEITIFF